MLSKEGVTVINGDRLDHCLGRADEIMGMLMRQLHIRMAQYVPPTMTHSQFLICRQILQHQRITVSELAEMLGVSLSAVTAAADKLCDAGFVVRQRDERDRRLVWMELTPVGEGAISGGMETWRQTLRGYFAQLPLEDVEKLVQVLEKLLEIVSSEENPEDQ
ncbi:MAG: MarR family transcriptional regulator [Desulforudis sp.]|jgi:DNA-binding MarR family transcriptional regulator|nr:MAG: MarR family transcriptional regulator [Desulforudis sp.]